MAGLYVHIPFCRRKCLYCDFYSVGERLADWPRLVDALLAEAEARVVPAIKGGEVFDTVYIGGGTPSLIPPGEFLRLAEGLMQFAPGCREFTIEVNPDDVTPAKTELWKAAGADRVSMGVQSFVDRELRAIGRRHDAETAEKAFRTLRTEFDNISLDLMFGLPGQSLSSLEETVNRFLALRPEHVSAYSLMYEERTALTRMLRDGRVREAAEEDSEAMFSTLSHALGLAGYEQYEISNYALPGRRSRHNSSYWRGVPYIGLGPGAHSYDGNRTRRENRPDLKTYLQQDFDHVSVTEILTDSDLREEMIMTRLRTREGLDMPVFGGRFGEQALDQLKRKSGKWIETGHLAADNGRLRLTRKGIMISDEIFVSLF